VKELTRNLVRLIDETTPYHKGEPTLEERLSKRPLGFGFYCAMSLPVVALFWQMIR